MDDYICRHDYINPCLLRPAFSMSQINLVKFEALAESFRNRMIFDFYPSAVENDYPTEQAKAQENGEKNNEYELPDDDKEQDKEEKKDAETEDLEELKAEVDEYIEENELGDIISATQTERGWYSFWKNNCCSRRVVPRCWMAPSRFFRRLARCLTTFRTLSKSRGIRITDKFLPSVTLPIGNSPEREPAV